MKSVKFMKEEEDNFNRRGTQMNRDNICLDFNQLDNHDVSGWCHFLSHGHFKIRLTQMTMDERGEFYPRIFADFRGLKYEPLKHGGHEGKIRIFY